MKRLPTFHLATTTVLAGLLLSGCSGLGGSSSLTCKMPDGARCDSVSNTYSESTRGELPGQRKRSMGGDASPAPSGTSQRGGDGPLMQIDPRMVPVGMPVRSQARVVRVWIKAWEDSDGDLHDQTFVYLPVSEGRWMVEHKQREARSAYAPVRTSTRAAMPESRASVALPPPPGTPMAIGASAQSTSTGSTPPPAPSTAGRPTERMNEAVQRARSAQPQPPATSLTRTEGGRSGS
jgi:conjugal transfer pilus assembly protein TraV